MTSPPEAPAAGFAFLEGRLRTAVQVAAAADQSPDDSLRGLYISDEQALSLAAGAAAVDADARMGIAAEQLRLDALDTAVLTVCAAPELHRRYGLLYAYLQDDVTRRLASPRLVADLLAGEGVERADVLACFAPGAPLSTSGAIRLCCPTRRRRWPTAPSRSRTGWPPSCSAPTTTWATPARRSRYGAPIRTPSHPAARKRSPRSGACSPPRRACRWPCAARTPPRSSPIAAEAPLMLVDVHDLERAEVMADATLAAALEGRLLCFDGLDDLKPAERRASCGRSTSAAERTIVIGRIRGEALALSDRTALLVERPDAVLRRAQRGLAAVLRRRGPGRRRGQVPALDRADPARRPRSAGSPRATPAATRPTPRTSTSARRYASVVAARRARRPARPRLPLGRPRAARPPARPPAARSPRISATATACSPSGATSARSRARRA